MKRIIIVIIVVIVVVLGGAGGLVMFKVVRNPFAPPPPASAETNSAPKQSANAPTAQLELVKVPDITMSVIVGGKVKQISLGMRLVATPAGRDRVAADVKNPAKDEKGGKLGRNGKFQDALLTELMGYFQEHFRTHDALDIDAISRKARAAAEKTFGEDVTDVLLTNVFESGGTLGGKGSFAPSE